MKTTMVVLAAGLASRYGSLKQIDQFGPSGETIIDYSIYDAIEAGFKKVVFIIRRNIEDEFKEVFIGKFGDRIEVDYAFQEIDIVPEKIVVPKERKKPWGTGHAVLMAEGKVDGPFAVVNADDFYGKESFKLLHNFLLGCDGNKLGGCLIGYLMKNTLSDHGFVSRGVCTVGDEACLRNIVERTHIFKGRGSEIYFKEGNKKYPLSGEEIVSMNLFGFTPKFFQILRDGFEKFAMEEADNPKSEYFLPLAVDTMIKTHRVNFPVLSTPDLTYGITYKEDKSIVKEMIEKSVKAGKYPGNLWQ